MHKEKEAEELKAYTFKPELIPRADEGKNLKTFAEVFFNIRDPRFNFNQPPPPKPKT